MAYHALHLARRHAKSGDYLICRISRRGSKSFRDDGTVLTSGDISFGDSGAAVAADDAAILRALQI